MRPASTLHAVWTWDSSEMPRGELFALSTLDAMGVLSDRFVSFFLSRAISLVILPMVWFSIYARPSFTSSTRKRIYTSSSHTSAMSWIPCIASTRFLLISSCLTYGFSSLMHSNLLASSRSILTRDGPLNFQVEATIRTQVERELARIRPVVDTAASIVQQIRDRCAYGWVLMMDLITIWGFTFHCPSLLNYCDVSSTYTSQFCTDFS